jgi:phosphate transport system ATP-binding protein
LFFDGRLIEEGPTEQLVLAPKHAETVRYVSGLFGDRRLLGVVVGATQPNGVANRGRER